MAQVTFKYEPANLFSLVGMVIYFEDDEAFYRIYSINPNEISVICLEGGTAGDIVGEKYIVPFSDLWSAKFTFCKTIID